MHPFMAFLILIVPMLEIYFLILVGGEIGLLWTLIALIAGVVIGINLIKQAGTQTMMAIHARIARGEAPGAEMAEGLLLVLAGFLLILPGFGSDLLALLLLIPTVRHGVRGLLGRHLSPAMNTQSAADAPASTTIIEGEYRKDPEDPGPAGGGSGLRLE